MIMGSVFWFRRRCSSGAPYRL